MFTLFLWRKGKEKEKKSHLSPLSACWNCISFVKSALNFSRSYNFFKVLIIFSPSFWTSIVWIERHINIRLSFDIRHRTGTLIFLWHFNMYWLGLTLIESLIPSFGPHMSSDLLFRTDHCVPSHGYVLKYWMSVAWPHSRHTPDLPKHWKKGDVRGGRGPSPVSCAGCYCFIISFIFNLNFFPKISFEQILSPSPNSCQIVPASICTRLHTWSFHLQTKARQGSNNKIQKSKQKVRKTKIQTKQEAHTKQSET